MDNDGVRFAHLFKLIGEADTFIVNYQLSIVHLIIDMLEEKV